MVMDRVVCELASSVYGKGLHLQVPESALMAITRKICTGQSQKRTTKACHSVSIEWSIGQRPVRSEEDSVQSCSDGSQLCMVLHTLQTHVVACHVQYCFISFRARPQMPLSSSDVSVANIATKISALAASQCFSSLKTDLLEEVAAEASPCIGATHRACRVRAFLQQRKLGIACLSVDSVGHTHLILLSCGH